MVSNLKPIDRYMIDMNSNLGKGQFGKVMKCYEVDDPEKTPLACKIIVR